LQLYVLEVDVAVSGRPGNASWAPYWSRKVRLDM